MPKRKITLENLINEFQQWRAIKKSGERIPTYLWEHVREVVPHYKLGASLNALGISSAQYRKHILKTASPASIQHSQATPIKSNSSAIKTKFVPVTTESSLSTLPAVALIFKRADGATVHYQCPPLEAVQSLIADFLRSH